MRYRLFLCSLVVVAVAIVPASAEARSVTPTSKKLVAGSAAVTSCASLAGVVTNFTISSNTVTAVLLTNIPSACNGGAVRVTVTNAGASLGTGGPVTVVSGAATVSISPAAAIGSVTHVRLAIVGP
jgi:hypothetical protein